MGPSRRHPKANLIPLGTYREHRSTLDRIAPSGPLLLNTEWELLDRLESELLHFLGDRELDGRMVLLKTSTAGDRGADHEVSTTVLERLLAVIRDAAPGTDLVVADGPAFDADYKSQVERFGWSELIDHYRARVVDLNLEPVIHSEHDLSFEPSDRRQRGLAYARTCADAAAIVSVARAKTHRRTGLSGAEKSQLGYLSGDVMGYPKLQRRHYLIPHIYDDMARLAAPTFHVVDGLGHLIEGEGPINGTARPADFLIFGRDPMAIDVDLARLFRFDPANVVSLFHHHHPVGGGPSSVVAITEGSNELLAQRPVQAPPQQPWLEDSLNRRRTWRNRMAYRSIKRSMNDLLHPGH